MRREIIFCIAFVMMPIQKGDAVQIIQDTLPYGEAAAGLGKGLGDGFAEAFAIAQAENRERARKLEERTQSNIDTYNNTVELLECSPTNLDIEIPESLKKFIRSNGVLKNGNKEIYYILKTKFIRGVGDGSMVEWFWSVNFLNVSKSGFLSSKRVSVSGQQLEITLLDKDGVPVSTCKTHTDLDLRNGDNITMKGKWCAPTAEISRVVSCHLSAR
jgi:hypothetical protein